MLLNPAKEMVIIGHNRVFSRVFGDQTWLKSNLVWLKRPLKPDEMMPNMS